jgi:hypothetical protein
VGLLAASGAAGCVKGVDGDIEQRRSAISECAPLVDQLAVNDDHSCARLHNGTIRCWGNNDFGQLGDGTQSSSAIPVQVVGIADGSGVTVGDHHSCGRGLDVQCWGSDAHGQLGNGGPIVATDFSTTPVVVPGWTTSIEITNSGSASIASGGDVTCSSHLDAFFSNCWGLAVWGQSSAGINSSSPSTPGGNVFDPVFLLPNTGPPTCAETLETFPGSGAGLRCWGDNSEGQLGTGATSGLGPLALVQPIGIDFTEWLATSPTRNCAVVDGGRVKCWGDTSRGGLGFGPTPMLVDGEDDVSQVSNGDGLTCWLHLNGTVACKKGMETPAVPVALSGPAVYIALGGHRACAALADGGVECWTWPDGSSMTLGSPTAVPFCAPTGGTDGGADGSDGAEETAEAGESEAGSEVLLPALSPLGDSCTDGLTCDSTFCSDQVCCESACGNGDLADCQTCGADGACTAIPGCSMVTVPSCSAGSCPVQTHAGSGDLVKKVSVGFHGTGAGEMSQKPCGPLPEEDLGYRIIKSATDDTELACADITVSASVGYTTTDLKLVCLFYGAAVLVDETGMPIAESTIRLKHYENDIWKDITQMPPRVYYQAATSTTPEQLGMICGNTNTLSPFAIFAPIDKMAPVISGVPGPISAYATSSAGAKITYATPKAVDAAEGTKPVSCLPASGQTFPLGPSEITCTSSDSFGNTATAKIPVWVKVQAPTDGSFFLFPIRANGSSIFRIGRPVPVRFELTGASAGITNLAAKLVVTKVSNTVQGTAEDTSDETDDDTDLLFKHRPLLKWYAYRWKTRGETQGTYRLRADLGDGVTHQINASLKAAK